MDQNDGKMDQNEGKMDQNKDKMHQNEGKMGQIPQNVSLFLTVEWQSRSNISKLCSSLNS